MRGDLHCHTTLSDGSAGIGEVIANAKLVGVDFLAITDHDSTSSFNRARVIGERYGVHIIEGVELSAFDQKRGRRVHILCYRPIKPDRLLGICTRNTENRKRAGAEMAKRVLHKFPIAPERITKYSSSSCIYRQHIMHALMDAGYTTSIYGELYNKLFRGEESCNVTMEYPDVYEVLATVHSAGGVAVMAHPPLYDSFALLDELIEQKLLDGIEVWHPKNREGDSERLLKTALKHDLIPTGGTDFHGMYNSVPVHIGEYYTPQKYLDRLFELQKEIQ